MSKRTEEGSSDGSGRPAEVAEDDARKGEVLARLSASPGRRGIGVGMLAILGLLLLWTALAHPPSAIGWLVFLLAAAAFSLWSAKLMWDATSKQIVLTRGGLFEEEGRMLALVAEIESVDRGLFAFKPSNGFLLRLHNRRRSAWALGLWWRMGRRVGVGGVTPGGQGRAMADIVSALLLEETAPRKGN